MSKKSTVKPVAANLSISAALCERTAAGMFKFTLGEPVILKGSRQHQERPIAMNIARLPIAPDSDTDDGMYRCIWHDKSGRRAEGFFPEHVLESLDPTWTSPS